MMAQPKTQKSSIPADTVGFQCPQRDLARPCLLSDLSTPAWLKEANAYSFAHSQTCLGNFGKNTLAISGNFGQFRQFHSEICISQSFQIMFNQITAFAFLHKESCIENEFTAPAGTAFNAKTKSQSEAISVSGIAPI